jgi:hypothetical protein
MFELHLCPPRRVALNPEDSDKFEGLSIRGRSAVKTLLSNAELDCLADFRSLRLNGNRIMSHGYSPYVRRPCQHSPNSGTPERSPWGWLFVVRRSNAFHGLVSRLHAGDSSVLRRSDRRIQPQMFLARRLHDSSSPCARLASNPSTCHPTLADIVAAPRARVRTDRDR